MARRGSVRGHGAEEALQDEEPGMSDNPIDRSRRTLLRSLAIAPIIAAVPATKSGGLIARDICRVAPRLTEGPYYLDLKMVRSDITEGRSGVPVEMAMQVVTADCARIAEARVDLWQCDAEGNYSGFSRQGSDTLLDTQSQTFLRGSQFTSADGVCTFRTIYPGWYAGRTTHFHYKVFLDERTVLASQIFLPDALNQSIYDNVPPYNARKAKRSTFNHNDFIAARAGDAAYATIGERSDGYAAAMVIGIDRKV
jgi:protocatechuate 3,4-dioxygenase beta subunit